MQFFSFYYIKLLVIYIIIASTGTQRRQGRSKNAALQVKIWENGGHPLPIMIPPHLWEPVGEYCSVFKTELGLIACMYATVVVDRWKNITDSTKLQWYIRIRVIVLYVSLSGR